MGINLNFRIESKNFAKGTAIIFIGLLLGKLLAMVNSVILARYLGPHNFGVFLLSISVLQFILIPSNLGIPSILPKLISDYNVNNQVRKINDILSVSIISCTTIALIFCILIYFFAPYISNGLFNTPELTIILRMLVFILPFSVSNNIMLSVYRGYEITRGRVLYSNLLPFIIRILLFMLFLQVGLVLSAAISAYVLSELFTYLFIRIDILKTLNIKIRLRFYNSDLSMLIKLAWPLLVQSYIWIIYTQIGRLFIGYYLSATEVGIYGAASALAGTVALIPQSFSYLSLPNFSKIISKYSIVELRIFYKKITCLMFFFTFPLFIVFVFLSKEILIFLYGDKFSDGAMTLLLIGGGMFSMCLAGPAADSLISAGHTTKPLIALTVGCCANIILNLFFIPRFGINGAAVANCSGMFIQRIAIALFNYKYMKVIPISKFELSWACICLFFIPIIINMRNSYLDINFIYMPLAGGLLYLITTYVLLLLLLRFTFYGKNWC